MLEYIALVDFTIVENFENVVFFQFELLNMKLFREY